jgi:hypothetical protein
VFVFKGYFLGFLWALFVSLVFFFVGALRRSLLYFLCNWVAPFQICAFLIYTTLLIKIFFFFFFYMYAKKKLKVNCPIYPTNNSIPDAEVNLLI